MRDSQGQFVSWLSNMGGIRNGKKTFTIIDQAGIHARPATVLVNAVSKFDAEMKLEYNGKNSKFKNLLWV
ncbi:hypothetical protein GCM10020331_091380 [Ectobacillus funiculus]